MHSNTLSFKPQVQHRTVRVFYFGTSFFIIIGLSLTFLFGDDALAAGLTMSGFAFLIGFLIWLQTSAVLMKYQIRREGIFIQRSWAKDLLKYKEIQLIALISAEEATEIASRENLERVKGINNRDFQSAIKGQLDFGKLIQYSSIQWVGSSQHVGRKEINSKVKTARVNFIYIVMQSGKQYLISPENATRFIQDVEKMADGHLTSYVSQEYVLINHKK